MARSKSEVIVKVIAFMDDFKALNSSPAEVISALKNEGISKGLFWNWRNRSDVQGNATVSKDIFTKLCEISGLSYADYYVGERVGKAKPHKTKTVHSTRLKNGVKVTTYTKVEPEKKPEVLNDDFALNLTSFKNHMEVYRKLLGINTSAITNDYGIDNYVNIVNGKDVLSISKYFKLSKIFMDTYKDYPESPLKDAFRELAFNYNDIYVGIIYFGDTLKKKRNK